VTVPEPRATRLDLRFRLFGVPVRVSPLFWASGAILGVLYYAGPDTGTFAWFLFWMAAVLVSVLVHELGHVLAGRLFGMRGRVVLYGLGGLTLGVDDLPRRWQRIVVLLGGPLAGFLVVAGVWGLTFLPPATDPNVAIAIGLDEVWLLKINLYWALLNLVPLWPLDGGRLAAEVGEGLFGRRGVTAALVLCLIVSGLLAIEVAMLIAAQLDDRFNPFYILRLMYFCALMLFCFLFWMRTFRALWPEAQPPAAA
jgi:membrane-associated protease RseP (regulator of RpoE activity)